MHQPSGVGLLTAEELRVARKSFRYRWNEQIDVPDRERVLPGGITQTQARDWWLIAFAHAMEYARVQRAKELLG